MSKHTETVRFWDYVISEPILIKIKRGQTLRHSRGGPTDEGWHRSSHVWHFDGEKVTCESVSDGADCDGRLTRYSMSECPISKLRAGYVDTVECIAFPAWEPVDESQRDYSAEAMGY
jgi:hypothetical protein